MKKILIIIVALMANMFTTQAQDKDIFGIHEYLGVSSDGYMYLNGVTVHSWEDGITLIGTYIQLPESNSSSDDVTYSKHMQNKKAYETDEQSVDLLNKGWADGKFHTINELKGVQPGYYFLFVKDGAGAIPAVIPFPVYAAKGDIPYIDPDAGPAMKYDLSNSKDVKLLMTFMKQQKIINEKQSMINEEQSEFNINIETRVEKLEAKEEVIEDTQEYLNTLDSEESNEPCYEPQGDISMYDDNFNEVAIAVEEEVEKIVWTENYLTVHGGTYFRKDTENNLEFFPIIGFSYGHYFHKRVGLGLGLDLAFLGKKYQEYTNGVTNGSVYGLIYEDTKSFSFFPYLELAFRPARRFSITLINGPEILSYTSDIQEDIIRTATGQVVEEGIPFTDKNTGYEGWLVGLGLDFRLPKAPISLGVRGIYARSVQFNLGFYW
jgi:hypothetical protein